MEGQTKYHKKNILIIGLGKTGLSAANFLEKLGNNIYLWDDNIKILSYYKKKKDINYKHLDEKIIKANDS